MAFKDLEPTYQRFVEMYVSEPFTTNADFAKVFECHPRTISDWIKKYNPEIEELSMEVTNRVKMKLQKLTEKALLKADELMGADSQQIQLQAMKSIMDNGITKRTESAVEMTGKAVQISIEEAK